MYERLQQFVPLGLQLPEVDLNSLAGLHVTEQDQVLLSHNLDGKAPWLDGTVSGVHLIGGAFELNWSVAQVQTRLQRFTPLGLRLPRLDHQDLSDLRFTQDEKILLSRNLDRKAPWLKGVVSEGHIFSAAIELNWSVAQVYGHLQRFIPLGLCLPELNLESLANLYITKQDEALSTYISSEDKSSSRNTVSSASMVYASLQLHWTVQQVYERLSRFIPLGLELPNVDIEQINSIQFTNTDSILLLRSLEPDNLEESISSEEFIWLKDTVPIAHIFVAAKILKWPVERVYRRFLELAPLGFQVPQMPLDQLANLEPSLVELVVLSCEHDALPPYLDNVVSAEHFARAMCKIAIPAAEVLRRLQRFAPFGLVLPSLEEIEEAMGNKG